MNGYVWLNLKFKDKNEYRFQVDGIKRGHYTKILDPIFKGWKEVGNGYNYKKGTEIVIYARVFSSDEEMIQWVKEKVIFPTIYKKCNAKCTTKVLIENSKEGNNDSIKRNPESTSDETKGRRLRKNKL